VNIIISTALINKQINQHSFDQQRRDVSVMLSKSWQTNTNKQTHFIDDSLILVEALASGEAILLLVSVIAVGNEA